MKEVKSKIFTGLDLVVVPGQKYETLSDDQSQ